MSIGPAPARGVIGRDGEQVIFDSGQMFDDFIAAAVHVEAMSEMSPIFHVVVPDIPSESHNQRRETFREKFFGRRNMGPKLGQPALHSQATRHVKRVILPCIFARIGPVG
jgi:hypothetical protein